MLGSPAPVVPSLADVPEDARSLLYVFANGVTPEETRRVRWVSRPTPSPGHGEQ